ncbi:MAG: transcriptional repressor LexA [Caldilineaceae bacterium]|nr:transcriptional repressor LexA [Caldilineaceae bacterium]
MSKAGERKGTERKLSERQRRILEFIVRFMQSHDYPPTIREIGLEVGITSTSVVNYNLTKLEEQQLIAREPEVSRGLSLNRDRLLELGLVGENAFLAAQSGARRAAGNGRGRIQVPILGHIAAGNPIMVDPRDVENAEEWIEIAEGLVNVPGDALFALRVEGDSMVDASVLDGDIVILRKQETASDGDMVAAWIEGDEETTLKFLYREGRNVRLMPANPNPEYQPIIRPADRVRINGKVVSVIRVLH